MNLLCRRIASSRWFQNGALPVIAASAVLIGVETSAARWGRCGGLSHALNAAVQVIFVVEIAVRLLAFGPRVHRFFLNGWNTVDFAIAALSRLPAAGPFATAARLARLPRALRVVSDRRRSTWGWRNCDSGWTAH